MPITPEQAREMLAKCERNPDRWPYSKNEGMTTAASHNAPQIGHCEFKPFAPQPPAPGKRIRQSSEPLMNKLEAEWFNVLKASHWMNHLRPQARRYELGNGIWYKPDAVGFDTRDGRETAYEVKGPHAFRGGFENLKFAARVWPEVRWLLVWKEGDEWKQQEVLS